MRAIAIPLVVLVAACQQAPSGKAPVTEAEALKVAETAEADYSSGDVARITGHYADDAVAFDSGHVDPTRDRKVMEGWTGQFVSMKPADFTVTSRNIQLLGPDAFVSSGVARFTVEAGQVRPQVGVRFSQVYTRGKDGQWKIVNEHMSMPPTAPGQPQA